MRERDDLDLSMALSMYESAFEEFTDDEIELIGGLFGEDWNDGDGGFHIERVPFADGEFEPSEESAEDCVARWQEESILHRAVMMLPPRQSQVIILRFGLCPLGDHTQQEAADLLGVSQPVAAKHEKAALENLRKILASMPEGLELIASRLIAMGKAA